MVDNQIIFQQISEKLDEIIRHLETINDTLGTISNSLID
jgi:hypothetical protein